MAIVDTSINRIRRVLQDESDTNYSDDELYQYFNDAIQFLSKELARVQARIGCTNTQLVYVAEDFSEALPTDFLALSFNEQGLPRVFNVSNDYARMRRAEVSDMDTWENETSANLGTVDSFIIDNGTMLVHPRPDIYTCVKIYYHPLKTITDNSSTMPWSSWFDTPIEQFVTRQCRLRSEMVGMMQIDVADYERLAQQAMDILRLRESNLISMKPNSNWGWSNG